MLRLVLKKHPRQKTLVHTGNNMRNTEQANALGTDPEKLSKCSFGAVAVPVASYTSQAIRTLTFFVPWLYKGTDFTGAAASFSPQET